MLKNKKLIIILILIVVIGSILLFINNKKYNYNQLLEKQEFDIVYDKTSTDKDKVPYININNSLINSINQEIDSKYQDYLLFSPNGFQYNYNVSGDILSLIIKAYVIHPESTHYDIIFSSYNINLREMKLLTNKEILDMYDISEEKMNYYLYNKFLNYYNDLLNKNYFTEEQCNFNSFLENKNVDDLLDDNYFYINNKHLELYKYFNIYTEFNEENYFDEESFHFSVT